MNIQTIFRTPRYLEKVDYEWFNLEIPLTFPGNNQHQTKTGMKFSLKDRDVVYDWFNVYIRVEFTFEALANGTNAVAETESAPINSSFPLITNMLERSAGKKLYEANDVHKVIFIKN